jgi:hypothetical protein
MYRMFPVPFPDDIQALVEPDHFRRVLKEVHLVGAGDEVAEPDADQPDEHSPVVELLK